MKSWYTKTQKVHLPHREEENCIALSLLPPNTITYAGNIYKANTPRYFDLRSPLSPATLAKPQKPVHQEMERKEKQDIQHDYK